MLRRLSKVVMCLALGLFAALVTYDNLVDEGSNYPFVGHVLSMDTTRPGNALMDRAIANPALWRAAYQLIVLGEGVTAILFLVAAGVLWRARRATAAAFQDAKKWVHAGATAAFLVWFFASWLLAANGLRCGSRRDGTDRKPPFASP